MLDVQPSLRVLVIEDDAASRLAIAKALREARHTVFEAVDGVTGLAIAQSEPLDAVVLDLMLPRLDGMRLLETLRRTSGVPVIVVSARQAEDDRVEALDRGADDYLTKPFTVRELLARLRAVVRRTEWEAPAVIEVGDVAIDFGARTVSRAGVRVPLTAAEFEILALSGAAPRRRRRPRRAAAGDPVRRQRDGQQRGGRPDATAAAETGAGLDRHAPRAGIHHRTARRRCVDHSSTRCAGGRRSG